VEIAFAGWRRRQLRGVRDPEGNLSALEPNASDLCGAYRKEVFVSETNSSAALAIKLLARSFLAVRENRGAL
jgi:hypothetical protein